MKILKTIGLILAGLIGLILIIAIFLPKKVATEQSIDINAPTELVFNAVNDFSQWEKWSSWNESDSTMVTTLAENYIGEGGSYSWTGEIVGDGKMTILSSEANKAIKTDVGFGPMGSANGFWTFEATDQGTKVDWDVVSNVTYPFNIMLLFMDFEDMMSKQFQRGLELLKEHAEAEAANQTSSYDVQEIDLPVKYFLGVRETIKMEDISSRFAVNFPKSFTAVTKNGIKLAGMPSAVYYYWDMDTGMTDVLQGMPISENKSVDGFTTIEFPASRALLVNYYGAYENILVAHEAIDAYIKEKELVHNLAVIEEYVTDPGEEPDMSKWLTKVVYYIKQ
jgi:effector-binding domain-containing protein